MPIKKALLIIILIAVALGIYLLLPSSHYNLDGFRVISSLHYVKIDHNQGITYTPLEWQSAYQNPYYQRQNVQKHLLFPLYAYFSYQLARLFGYQGNGLKPLQIANTISAAVSLGLFALLLLVRKKPLFTILFCSIGLAFSNAFCSMATDIAEVVFALPFLILSLILIDRKKPFWAGLFFGISAACYLLSLIIALALTIGLLVRRQVKTALILFITTTLATLIVYLALLFLAGYHNLNRLFYALTFMPEQGTYGGLKISNIFTIFIGFANSLFPFLSQGFYGMREIISAGGIRLVTFLSLALLGMALAFLCLFFNLKKSRDRNELPSGAIIFLGALFSSLIWDPYHLKIWVYANIGFWLMLSDIINLTLASLKPQKVFRLVPFFIFLLALAVANISHLVKLNKPNPKWQAAKTIAQTVRTNPANVVFGSWEPEFSYLSIFVPENSLFCLPDLILESRRDPVAVQAEIQRAITDSRNQTGTVYFVNIFNRSEQELKRVYAIRLRSPWFLSLIENLRPLTEPVWQDENSSTTLYQLNQPIP